MITPSHIPSLAAEAFSSATSSRLSSACTTRFRKARGPFGISTLLALTACGGGGSSSAPPPPAPTYTIGGTVSGLTGSGLVLQNNGSNDLTVSSNGSFVFSTALAGNAAYAVTVATQPSNPTQSCVVAGGSGTVANSNISAVQVTCTTSSFTVGGSVSGLAGTGLSLQLNGANSLAIAANGSFSFPSTLASGTAYTVTVATPPTGPAQSCAVSNGSGTVGAAAVTNVGVACTILAGNLQSTVPTPSYAAASPALALFTALNDARSGGGFGKLAQSAALDTAALAHARYLAANAYNTSTAQFDPVALSVAGTGGQLAAHLETSGVNGFTGDVPGARAQAAGYASATVQEATAFTVGNGDGNCSDQLLDSVSLRNVALGTENRDVGIGIAPTSDSKGTVCVVLTGYGATRGQAPGDFVGIYPFNTQTGVSIAMSSDATATTLGVVRGVPITIAAEIGATLNISTVTMRRVSNNGGVNVVLNRTAPNVVHAVPQAYLAQNEQYSVRVQGTIGTLAIDQTRTFTTGARSRSSVFTPTTGVKKMRAVLALPLGVALKTEYPSAIQNSLEHLQGWYQQQLSGRTFDLYAATPTICQLPQNAAFYGSDSFNKVMADLQPCAAVQFNDPNYDWVVYADLIHTCNAPGRLGAGAPSITILPHGDLEGLVGRDTGIDDCGISGPVFGVNRFIGGTGHEVGHSFGLPHPPNCDANLPGCDANALMWAGYGAYPATFLRSDNIAALLAHRFINVQRFGR